MILMADNTSFATPRQIQDLATKRYQDGKPLFSFPEGVIELFRKHKLSQLQPAVPSFKMNMSLDEFSNYLLDMPFKVNNIVSHPPNIASVPSAEAEIFPHKNDIFCFKLLSYLERKYHTHDYFEITIVLDGTLTLMFEGTNLTMSTGDFCIIPPLAPHCQPINSDSFSLGISIRKSTFDKVFSNLLNKKDLLSTFFRNSLFGTNQSNYLKMKTELTPRILFTLQQLAYESYQTDIYANPSSINLLNQFFYLILRNYSDSITIYDDSIFLKDTYDFAQILHYVQQNYQTITLTSLAEKFHFSSAYLSKLFTRHLGKGFSSIIIDLKMDKASELLCETTLSINEICTTIGYQAPEHFSRAFKNIFGCNPKDYRRNYNDKNSIKKTPDRMH